MSKAIALKPRQSEKTYAQAVALNVFVFDVPMSQNKIEIARAVEAQFDVTVTNVRVVIVKGKTARSIRIGGARKNVEGRRSDYKKAYVTLKAGDSIPVFAAVEEAEAKAEKAAKKTAAKTETKQTDDKPAEKPKKSILGRKKKEETK